MIYNYACSLSSPCPKSDGLGCPVDSCTPTSKGWLKCDCHTWTQMLKTSNPQTELAHLAIWPFAMVFQRVAIPTAARYLQRFSYGGVVHVSTTGIAKYSINPIHLSLESFQPALIPSGNSSLESLNVHTFFKLGKKIEKNQECSSWSMIGVIGTLWVSPVPKHAK